MDTNLNNPLKNGLKTGIIILLAMAAIVIAILKPPFPQDLNYHNFADNRNFFGIPNFFDIISNTPFLFAGILGLTFVFKLKKNNSSNAFITGSEKQPYTVFFTGIALTSIGSAYYHYSPDNLTLFWDRLPMTIAFMSYFGAVIGEKINTKAGKILLIPLIIIGIASVVYWDYSETIGAGDLRPYILVQFYPIIAIPLIVLMFPSRYTRSRDFIIIIFIYILAKVFEIFDKEVFLFGQILSGHTIKHMVAAFASYRVLVMLKKRQPME